jgi:hypothetical protein
LKEAFRRDLKRGALDVEGRNWKLAVGSWQLAVVATDIDAACTLRRDLAWRV